MTKVTLSGSVYEATAASLDRIPDLMDAVDVISNPATGFTTRAGIDAIKTVLTIGLEEKNPDFVRTIGSIRVPIQELTVAVNEILIAGGLRDAGELAPASMAPVVVVETAPEMAPEMAPIESVYPDPEKDVSGSTT